MAIGSLLTLSGVGPLGSTPHPSAQTPAVPPRPTGAALASGFSPVWSELTTTGTPSARAGMGVAYDPTLSAVVIFGGCTAAHLWNYDCTPVAQTWALDGDQWTNLTTSGGPSARIAPMMTYDAADGVVLLFGGWAGKATSTCYTDTWEFTSSGWTELFPTTSPGCGYAGMVYDSALGHVILLAAASGTSGAEDVNNTWEFTGTDWQRLTPTASFSPPRSEGAVVFDPIASQIVLFGGYSCTPSCTNLGDTWTFDGTTWTQQSPTTSPAWRNQPGATYDPLAGSVVVFGGHDGYTFYDDTWLYRSGDWTQLSGGSAPSVRWAPAMVFDPVGERTVMFGGYNYTSNLDQFSAETWVLAFPSPLTAVSVVAQPATLTVGQELFVSVSTTGGLGTLSFNYTGLPPGCASVNLSFVACDPTTPGSYIIHATVTDQVGRSLSGSASVTVEAAPPPVTGAPPSISNFLALPSTVDVFSTTELVTVAAGGTGPLSYAYESLPAGCASANLSVIACTPTTPGNFTVGVTVSDLIGETATALTNLTVLPPPPPPPPPAPPDVVGIVISPSSPVAGELLLLEVLVGNPSTADAVSYAGLPPGCPSANTTLLACVPSGSGAFSVTVTVTAPDGLSGSRTASGDVAPAPTPTTPSTQESPVSPTLWLLAEVAVALGAVGAAIGVVALLRRPRPPAG